ncbi:MAG: hypothetical protein IJX93_04775 [Clostridia bacterium]|nr:hypothetical protein [Clostridia bacterium]MBQ8368413.1 hypothetical protein [Clostridia bacterium]
MKNELNKKIKKLCDEAGSAAAAEKFEELSDKMEAEYDARVKAGMSELDAYRDVLKDVDKIRELLDSLPKTAEDEDRKSRQLSFKWLSKNLSRISGCMWIMTAIVYILFSMTYGGWEITWLIFLWSAIGQILLNMAKKVNRGVKLKKVLKGGLSGILWIAAMMFYFFVSMYTMDWHLTWLLFPFTAILQIMLNALFGD